MIITANESSKCFKYFMGLGYDVIRIPDSQNITESILKDKINRDTIAPKEHHDRIFKIVAKKIEKNDSKGDSVPMSPLFLRTLVSTLSPYVTPGINEKFLEETQKIFKGVFENFDYDSLEEIDTVEQLLEFIVEFYKEKITSQSYYIKFLGCLTLTLKGLTEDEILRLAIISHNEFMALISIFKNFIMNHSQFGTTYYKNSSEVFQKFVLKKFLSSSKDSQKAHNDIAESLESNAPSIRKLEEQTYHYFKAGNSFQLKQVISKVENFLLLFNPVNKYDLCRFWQMLESKEYDPVVEYNKNLELFEMHFQPSEEDLFKMIIQLARFLKEFSDFETKFTPEFRHPLIRNKIIQVKAQQPQNTSNFLSSSKFPPRLGASRKESERDLRPKAGASMLKSFGGNKSSIFQQTSFAFEPSKIGLKDGSPAKKLNVGAYPPEMMFAGIHTPWADWEEEVNKAINETQKNQGKKLTSQASIIGGVTATNSPLKQPTKKDLGECEALEPLLIQDEEEVTRGLRKVNYLKKIGLYKELVKINLYDRNQYMQVLRNYERENVDIPSGKERFRQHFFQELSEANSYSVQNNGGVEISGGSDSAQCEFEVDEDEQLEGIKKKEFNFADLERGEGEEGKKKTFFDLLSLEIGEEAAPTFYYYKRWIWIIFPWSCLSQDKNQDFSEMIEQCYSEKLYLSVAQEKDLFAQALKIAMDAKSKKAKMIGSENSKSFSKVANEAIRRGLRVEGSSMGNEESIRIGSNILQEENSQMVEAGFPAEEMKEGEDFSNTDRFNLRVMTNPKAKKPMENHNGVFSTGTELERGGFGTSRTNQMASEKKGSTQRIQLPKINLTNKDQLNLGTSKSTFGKTPFQTHSKGSTNAFRIDHSSIQMNKRMKFLQTRDYFNQENHSYSLARLQTEKNFMSVTTEGRKDSENLEKPSRSDVYFHKGSSGFGSKLNPGKTAMSEIKHTTMVKIGEMMASTSSINSVMAQLNEVAIHQRERGVEIYQEKNKELMERLNTIAFKMRSSAKKLKELRNEEKIVEQKLAPDELCKFEIRLGELDKKLKENEGNSKIAFNKQIRLQRIIDICIMNRDQNEEWIRQLNVLITSFAKMISEEQEKQAKIHDDIIEAEMLMTEYLETHSEHKINKQKFLNVVQDKVKEVIGYSDQVGANEDSICSQMVEEKASSRMEVEALKSQVEISTSTRKEIKTVKNTLAAYEGEYERFKGIFALMGSQDPEEKLKFQKLIRKIEKGNELNQAVLAKREALAKAKATLEKKKMRLQTFLDANVPPLPDLHHEELIQSLNNKYGSLLAKNESKRKPI